MQFYHDDAELLRVLTRYVGTALVGGDVAIVVATGPHRIALDHRLAARGLDVSVARGEGRYVTIDAQTLLDTFLIAGRVDTRKALGVVGEVLTRACSMQNVDGGPAHVFAFGEMVALVTAQRDPEEAVRLEEVWNTLGNAYDFTLCCGYPMATFSPRHAAPFVRICGLHTHVFHASHRNRTPLVGSLT